MKKIKSAFNWLCSEVYVIWRMFLGDTQNVAQTRYNVRKMNKATIKATGRSMGRFRVVVDGEEIWFDFKGGKKPAQQSRK